MELNTLKHHLKDWTDIDVAAYRLAICLGLIKPDVPFATRAKHVFWTNHPIGTILFKMLESLTQAGVLEKRDEPDFQFRWNAQFRGSWE